MQSLLFLRKKRNLTQKDVADHLGISRQAYANYETGSREPDLNTLKELADFFNVSVDHLLGIDTLNPSTKSESIPENCIMLRGRDGTVIEGELTDEQIELIKLMIEQRNKK